MAKLAKLNLKSFSVNYLFKKIRYRFSPVFLDPDHNSEKHLEPKKHARVLNNETQLLTKWGSPGYKILTK